jgi:formate dehydrogenase iron-sulfur subunit
VLLLSSVPFEEFGYQSGLANESMPQLTYRVLSKVPDVVTLGGVLLGGVWWITNRRTEVAAAERDEKAPSVQSEERGQKKNG